MHRAGRWTKSCGTVTAALLVGAGKVLYNAFSWLESATPVWLALCVLTAFAALGWQLLAVVKRVDRHAQSIAHMDEWADAVDHRLTQIEERSRRSLPAASAKPPPPLPKTPPPAAPRAALDLRNWKQK